MTGTSTTIPEANLQPNGVGQITPSVRPQRPMVAEPEQEEPRWSATGCDVEQARLESKCTGGEQWPRAVLRQRNCGLLVTAFRVQHLYCHC